MITTLALGLMLASFGQEAKLLHNTFDRGVEGWAAMQIQGDGSKVETIYDKALLKASAGTLSYSYRIAQGQVSIAGLNVGAGTLTGMNSLRFWMQADHDTTIVVILQEKDGGRYTAACHATKNSWQDVQLGLDDFVLAREKDAPNDPDGKLDADKVESVAIIDLETYLAQNPTFADVLGVSTGNRKLYLSDVQFLHSKAPGAASSSDEGYRLDSFARPQLGWMGFGVQKMQYAVDSPFTGKWMKLDYHTSAGHVNGVAHALKVGDLEGKKNLNIEIGAARDCQLIVQFELVNGAKFNAPIDVPGLAKSKVITVPLSSMTISDDSPDKSATFDQSQIKQVVLLDISGMLQGVDADQTLYVGRIVAK